MEIDRTDWPSRSELPIAAYAAATTLAWSQSSKSVFDYDVANIGGALSLTFKF